MFFEKPKFHPSESVISVNFISCRRAANAARAMAALTSSSMSGVFPPIAAALPLMPPMATVPPIIPAKGLFVIENLHIGMDA